MISSLELSRLCGVSQGTVDRALHDRPGISEATKRRILGAAATHGYRPHPAARELLTGTSLTVGAIVPASRGVFFMDLLDAIRVPLAAAGLRFFLAPVADEAGFADALDDLAARRSRAVIAVPPADGFRVPAHVGRMTTVVSITNAMLGRGVRSVVPDERRAGRDAVAYLAGRGHRRIVHVTYGRDVFAIRERARGYTEGMRGLGVRGVIVRPYDQRRLVDEVVERGATAVFCHNDWLALTATRALEAAGRRVPRDVSVMGVDDSPTFVELYPGLTTLHYPAESIARAVAAIVAGARVPPLDAMSVVERESVGSV